MIKITSIKFNPKNPRIIRDDKFDKLKQSIKDFPEMMALRPIIVDDKMTVIGGSMRLKSLIDLGYKELPENWILKAGELNEKQKQEFIIKDNLGFGEWDYDMLDVDWQSEDLDKWGLDIPKFVENEEAEPETDSQYFLNIRCDNESQAQKLYEKFLGQGLDVKIIT